MTLGWISSICRTRYGLHAFTSSGVGLRLPGGRCFRTLQMKTSSRVRSIAARILVSSCPACADEGVPGLVLARARRFADAHEARARIRRRRARDSSRWRGAHSRAGRDERGDLLERRGRAERRPRRARGRRRRRRGRHRASPPAPSRRARRRGAGNSPRGAVASRRFGGGRRAAAASVSRQPPASVGARRARFALRAEEPHHVLDVEAVEDELALAHLAALLEVAAQEVLSVHRAAPRRDRAGCVGDVGLRHQRERARASPSLRDERDAVGVDAEAGARLRSRR